MQPSKLFLERLEKVKKTTVSENDGVTTCYMGTATPPAHYGISMAKYITDPQLSLHTILKYINEINSIAPIDCLNIGSTAYGMNVILSIMWLSKVKSPGKELPENSLWQVMEQKVMQDEDYDLVINKGYDALVQKILPQVVDMGEFQKVMQYNMENGAKDGLKFVENNYPGVNVNAISPPFETLCGARSMPQFFRDCYKIPEKVQAAMDVMLPAIIKSSVDIVKQAHGYGTWIGGWRGASALVSPKIWDKFVWPYMYETAMALIKNDIVPVFHLDQSWDRDIERFLELPAKKCILNTDSMTDLKIARKKLGYHVSFMGDVPPALLSIGKPEEVSDYVKDLLDNVGPKGLFVTPGCDAPANAKFENMVEMYKTAVNYI